ncbi:MAG: diacylglycerol kinase family lipid kinase [Candidatus Acidiferrum sp.]
MSGSAYKDRFLAIVNPAAGGGRAAKLAGPALTRLREKNLRVDVIASTSPRHAAHLAREAYDQGYRRFLAVGGDGTAHEIINGVFGRSENTERIALGLLPFGTGNSFLRDFTKEGAESALQAILAGRSRQVDLLRLNHAQGQIHSFNLLSLGFTADVGALANRRFKSFGHLGYLFGVIVGILKLRRLVFKLRCDDEEQWDQRRSLFLAFNNSKYTGGTMLIAPDADPCDGFIEFVRWGPIGRFGLLRTLPKLYDGTHIKHPMASRRSVKRVEFDVPVPIDVMIDGEIATLECRSLDILPGAIDIYI